jgi:hypothetical protein
MVTSLHRHVFVVFMSGAAALASACAGPSPEVRMVSSPDIPAAQGTVRATPGENGNTTLRVFVRHLAPPQKVRPDATTYVVWVQPAGGAPQNMGALKVDDDLRGTLTTVTPLTSFEVFITVETSPKVQEPSAGNLLSASVVR